MNWAVSLQPEHNVHPNAGGDTWCPQVIHSYLCENSHNQSVGEKHTVLAQIWSGDKSPAGVG